MMNIEIIRGVEVSSCSWIWGVFVSRGEKNLYRDTQSS